jgi:cytochrome c-type biogenesis protein CcmF
LILDKMAVNPNNDKFHFKDTDTAMMAEIRIVSKDSTTYQATPLFYVRNNQIFHIADTVFAQNLALNLGKIIDHNKIELLVKESSSMVPFVALKVLQFPQINLFWIGALIMIIGFLMSIVRRIRALVSSPGM